MNINLKEIWTLNGKDILIAYLVVAIDVIGGFEADLNFINWSSKKVLKFIIIFIVITVVNFIIKKYKNKTKP
mgnify:CR=1 FL=1|tara:strand:+ start:1954 stop:2169 length:216 start_codon:yes stop_codon:yes gene_type:complete